MHNFVRTVCLLMMFGITSVSASEQIRHHVPNLLKVGDGRFSVLFWDVYDVALYAPNGQWSYNQPFALKLSYLRDITGKEIADSSIEEIRNQGFDDEVKLADWYAQMVKIFPDVDEQSTLTGIYTENGETIFLNNSQELGRIQSTEFGQHFFDIWLGLKTSSPKLRAKLLGES